MAKRSTHALIGAMTLALMMVAACSTKSGVPEREPVGDSATLVVYLQPLPPATSRLDFTLDSLVAVGEGRKAPLSLSMADIRTSDLGRQRLLARARVPAGVYSGLRLGVKRASYFDSEMSSELAVDEAPVRIDAAFRLEPREATVLWLTLRPSESILRPEMPVPSDGSTPTEEPTPSYALREGSRFVPVFDAVVPEKPLLSLVGYVTNTASDDITVFDKRLGQAVAAIATGTAPKGVVLNRDSGLAYVASSGYHAGVDVIDMVANRVIDRIPLHAGDEPTELALTEDGRTLLCTNRGSDSVSFIDTGALSETGRINVEEGPTEVLLSPGGERAFVLNSRSSTISVLDIAKQSHRATLSVEQGPSHGDFSRDGERLYVIHDWSPHMLAIELPTLTVADRTFFGMGTTAIKVDERTDSIYVYRRGDRWLQASDPLSLIPSPSLEVAGAVRDMAIDKEERDLYVLSAEQNTLAIVDLVTERTESRIDVGPDPYAVAVVGER